MNKTKLRYWTSEITTAFLTLLFTYAALSKLFAFKDSARALLNIPLLAPYHIAITIGVPVAELIVAGLLIIPGTRKIALLLSLVLLAAFTTYIVYILLAYAGELPCTCGGIIAKMTWRQHLVFNLACMAAAWMGYNTYSKQHRSGEAEHLEYSRHHYQIKS